jgi:hypothetical protein
VAVAVAVAVALGVLVALGHSGGARRGARHHVVRVGVVVEVAAVVIEAALSPSDVQRQ